MARLLRPDLAIGSLPMEKIDMYRAATFLFLTLLAGGNARATSIDPVFAGFTQATPGCAVAVQTANAAPVLRAFGSADLEHGIANSPDTVFEAGSVSKQFTAAAIMLLVRDGKIALKDDVRRYIPELADYGTPITIADLLSHTSGLRDWGDVEDIAGWPRGDRVYSLADVLHITAAQRGLNYKPGQDWSYTNTGYNLAAIVVQRVSGKSLATFTRERLFVPLGMKHTRWRDDFRRVEPGRAIAYSRRDDGAFEQDMPFENAYGNGGLLTTVGDLLIWNRALSENSIGGDIARDLATPAKLSGGEATGYGKGLFVQHYLGREEISHSGATAGYRAWLGRYPEQKLSIALLCNDGNVDPTRIAHAVAAAFLPASPAPAPVSPAEEMKLRNYAGWYDEERSGASLHLSVAGNRLVGEHAVPVEHDPDGGFRLGSKPIAFLPDGSLAITQAGVPAHFRRAEAFAPDQAMLERIVGRYRSDEADVVYRITRQADGLHLVVEERPDEAYRLTPAFKDAFTFGGKTLHVIWGNKAQPVAIEVTSSRVWRLNLTRMP